MYNNILELFSKVEKFKYDPTFNPLKLIMPQNSHAHYENLAASISKILKVCLTILGNYELPLN